MGELAVTLRLHGQVVEDRVLPVRRMLRLGERPDALVSFPGADLCVVRVDGGLRVRGRTLAEGDELVLALGPVEVRLVHTAPGRRKGWDRSSFDLRFLVYAIVVASVGTWTDAVGRWLEARTQAQGLPALLAVAEELAQGDDQARTAAASSPAR